MKYTNHFNIPISMAIWLATDTYDHDSDPKTISATGLLGSNKSIIMKSRLKTESSMADIHDLVKAQLGTAIHTAVENAWNGDVAKCLHILGLLGADGESPYVINPTEAVGPNQVSVYIERRSKKEIAGYTLSGKFDMCMDGTLRDTKSTSIYSWVMGSNNDRYAMQGSIYKWLNQDIVTEDHMYIDYVFTDWKANQALADKTYPQAAVKEKLLPLWPVDKTELWIKNKLNALNCDWNKDQDDLTPCNSEELWQKETVYAYYKDANKTTRSTKNFKDAGEANQRCFTDGNKGVVVTRPGEVIACRYCSAVSVCNQAKTYNQQGLLNL